MSINCTTAAGQRRLPITGGVGNGRNDTEQLAQIGRYRVLGVRASLAPGYVADGLMTKGVRGLGLRSLWLVAPPIAVRSCADFLVRQPCRS
jgi:hypothetical protein